MNHDIVLKKPARIGILVDERPLMGSGGEFERVHGSDLRALAHRAAALRDDHPGVDIVADIEVVLADTAATARALVAGAGLAPPGDTVRYVGTPDGLAGLLADIHALGIADGALLQPLLPGTADLIIERTMEVLRTMGELPSPVSEVRSA